MDTHRPCDLNWELFKGSYYFSNNFFDNNSFTVFVFFFAFFYILSLNFSFISVYRPSISVKVSSVQPFKNWSPNPAYNSPDWWSPYNRVKHERLENFRDANLKNVANALAGLYILESYLVKFIGDFCGKYCASSIELSYSLFPKESSSECPSTHVIIPL